MPYILVCTRFVNAAHAEGQEVPFLRRMYSTGWPDSFDARAIANVVFTQWQQAVHDFADLVVLVKELRSPIRITRIVSDRTPAKT